MRKLLPSRARSFLCFLLVGMSTWLYAGSPLSGAYTINPANPASSTNFTSFSMAADSLTTNGVSGAVTVTVSAGTYTEYMSLGAIAGASSTNTITIDGGSNATTTIAHDGTTENHVILLDGAKWVTITNLSISNSKIIDDAWGVRIANESDNATISNCIIQMGVVTGFEDMAGILANGSATASSTEGTYGDNITIDNVEIRDGYYGMRMESSLWNDTNMTITNCWFNGNIGYGTYSDNLVGLTIMSSKVDGGSLTSKDGFYNIDVIDFNIQSNQTDVPDYGLYIADGNFDLTLPATRSKIINNMFASSDDEAMYFDDINQCDIFHNTAATFGSLTSAYGVRFNDLDDVVIKNNIFYAAAGHAFYSVDDLSASTTVSYDYNVYYTGGASLIYNAFANQFADLAAWQLADAGNNVNSVEGDPVFGMGTDLHVSGVVANDVGDNLVGITTDIDEQARPLAPSTTVDIGADEFAAATCQQPSGLGAFNITSTTAEIFWTSGGASLWNAQIVLAGSAFGSGIAVPVSNDTTFLSSMAPNTSFDFYVQDSCGLGDVSGWSGPFTFTTLCAAHSTFPWVENFDAAASIPNCWENEAGDNSDWLFRSGSIGHGSTSDNTTGSGNYAGMDDSHSSANDTVNNLLTPSFDLTSLTTPRLNFYHFIGNDNVLTSTLYIDVYDGTTWNMAAATIGFTAAAWQQEFVDLTPYKSTNSRIRFRGHETTDFNSDVSIDDITVEETPACPSPTGLAIFAVSATGASAGWVSGGTSFEVQYGATGFVAGSGTSMISANDTATLSGLTDATNYDVYIREICGIGDTSAWVGPESFTTLCLTQSLPYSENFDINAGCFISIDGGTGTGDSWVHTINGSQNLDGTGYMRVDSDANGNGTHLIETTESPIIDASTVSNSLVLEFDHYFRSGDSASVLVYDGANWITVAVYQNNTGAWSNPSHEIIDVTAYANAAFQVRFLYDDGNTWAWYWAVDNFSIEDKCLTQTLPYAENFDANIGCFTTIDGGAATGDTWAHSTSGSNLDGTGYMRVDSDANGNGTHMIETMESPVIDAAGITGTLLLEFDHYYRTITGDSGTVQVWDGASWTNVATFTSDIGAFGAPDHQMIDISAYANANLQVRFHYDDNNSWAWYWNVDNFSVAEVGCLQPSALASMNVAQTTADIYWTTGGATDWLIEYGPAGFTPGTGTTVIATNDTTTLTGLMASTDYDVYVADSCGIGSVSTYAGPISVSTLCAAFTAPFTESFDGTAIPNCWNQAAVTGGPWSFQGNANSVNCPAPTDNSGTGGNYAWMDQSGGDVSVSLVTPEIDVTALTVPYLEFYYWMCGTGYTPTNMTVIETWDGSAWSLLDTMKQATAGWEAQGYDLTGRTYGTNLVQVRFTAESGGSGSDFFGDNSLDDISVVEKPACPVPTGLSVISSDDTSGVVGWLTGGASNWNIQIGLSGFALGTGFVAPVIDDTIQISGLAAGTAYDVYVQDSCGLGDVSGWVGPVTIITTVSCPAIESLPFTENFDLSEGCFDTIDGGAASGDGWAHTVNAGQNLDGTGYMRVDSDANGNGVHMIETMESPVIDASIVNNSLILEFDHFYRPIGADSGVVQVFDGTAWVSVASYNTQIGAFGAPVREVLDVTAYANAAFQVRFQYDDGNSWAWYWSVDNFSVEDKCAVQSLPYAENFDVDQGCFNTIDGGAATGDTWAHTVNAGQNLDGTGYMRVDSDANGNGTHMIETMESPVIDATGITGTLLLEFDHYYRTITGDSGTVQVWDGASWTNVATFTSDIGAFGAPDHQMIDISAYANANLQVRFHYDDNNSWAWYWSVDNFSVAEVGCLQPSALGSMNITQTGADIYWTSGGATDWLIEYGPAGFTPGTGTTVIATNDTTTLTGLMASTDYDVYVADSCGIGSVSTYAGPISVSTLCSIFTAPFTESFDGTALPNCWNEAAVTGGPWSFQGNANSVNCPAPTDNSGTGGNYAWMDQSGGDASVSLITPEIDVTALTVPYLEFYYWMCGTGYTPTNMTVIETWDGSAWSLLDTMKQATAGWEVQGYDLTGRTYGTNLVQVRFTAESGGSGSDFFGDNSLDDISVIEQPACPAPSGLTLVSVDDTSGVFTWTSGGASNWNIEIGLAGFTPGTGTVLGVLNDTVQIIGFAPGTAYEIYVQDSCGLGDVSAWVGPLGFATTVNCPPLESLPFFENFDISEGCFDTIDGGGASGDGWAFTVNAVQNLDGTGYMRVDSDANGNGIHLIETMESPVIDASVVNNSLILEFDHFYRPIGADSGVVQVFDGATWVTVASYNTLIGAFGAPVREVLDVTAYANAAFQVRFHYDDGNSWAWYWNVDNFSVEDKCAVQSLPYAENFDVDQGCFGTIDGGAATGDTWAHTVNAGQNLDGTGYMRVDSDANGNGIALDEELVSPVIDAGAITGTLMLEFDHFYRTIGSDTGWVDVYDGASWINVAMFTADIGAFGAPDAQAIDISAYANSNLQVRFVYNDGNSWAWYWNVDNFSVAEVGCVAPSALGHDATTATQTSVDIFWTTGGAANWNVEYGPQGFAPGTGTFLSATNDSITISSLMSATCYDFYVQDSCGLGDVSTFTGPYTFCTACGPFVAPYTESFDATSTPLCWSESAVSGGPWLYSTGLNSVNCPGAPDHTGNGGNYAWMDQSGTDTLVSLEMNDVDVSGLTTPYLEFFYWMCGSGYTPINMTIIETWDGSAWSLLDTMKQSTNGWELQGYNLAGRTYGANLVKVRFTAESGRSGSDFFGDNGIDDVTIKEEPACLDPTNFMVTGNSLTTIDVAWTSDVNILSSRVEYGAPGFVLGSGTSVTTATPGTLSLTGLAPGTCYEMYVQDSCTALTAWLGPIIGCTGAVCNVTTTPTVTGDSAICGGGPITLTGTAGSGDIAWMLNGTVLGTGNSFNDSIGGTTVYSAADYAVVAPAVHLGPLTSIAAAGFGNFSNGQWFTVMDTLSIDSCTVRANGFVEGSVIIFDDDGGNIVQIGDTFTTGATLGDYQVPINVVLTPGNYFMGVDFHVPTLGQLFRATSGASYPYTIPGLMSIDSVNFAGARYYYTFDLIVSGACLGASVPVTGFVPGPNSGTSDTVNVCETDTAANLAAFLGVHDGGGTWVDSDLSGALTDSLFNATLADTNSYYNFQYILAPSGGCSVGDTSTITVLVNFQLNSGSDGADTICTDGLALVSLTQYLGNHTGGGSWADLDSSGALIGFRVRPTNVVGPGTYRYQYTVASSGACPGGTSIVTITFEDPVSAGAGVSDTICNNAGSVDLSAFLDTNASSGGAWIDMDATGALTGSNIDPTVPAAGAWYNFAYAVTSVGCGNDTAFFTFYIKACDIGLAEQTARQFNVYPNPTKGVFFIESLGAEVKEMQVEVYSINGQLLTKIEFNGYNTANQVDLTDLAKGVYNVKVISEFGVEVHKITRQ